MIITPLLQLAAEKKASDLFLSVGAPISIKINGVTMPVNAQKLDADSTKRIDRRALPGALQRRGLVAEERIDPGRAERAGELRVQVGGQLCKRRLTRCFKGFAHQPAVGAPAIQQGGPGLDFARDSHVWERH